MPDEAHLGAGIRYTLCFLTRGREVLLLHRRRPPNQGLWNGVGGHIEPGEAPLAACLREVLEETGYRLPTARCAGLLTWDGFETPPGGLYIYAAEAPAEEPGPCGEGERRWHPWNWMLTSPQVVSNIHHFGPEVLAGAPPRWHHFVYERGEIVGYRASAWNLPGEAGRGAG
jgi:8-oxo-dGTP diphosphatase